MGSCGAKGNLIDVVRWDGANLQGRLALRLVQAHEATRQGSTNRSRTSNEPHFDRSQNTEENKRIDCLQLE